MAHLPGPGALDGRLLRSLGAVVVGHVHVLGSEDEDVVGDLLHVAVEGVGGSAEEVEDLSGDLGLQVLQVDDDGLLGLEQVHQPGALVEALGLHYHQLDVFGGEP